MATRLDLRCGGGMPSTSWCDCIAARSAPSRCRLQWAHERKVSAPSGLRCEQAEEPVSGCGRREGPSGERAAAEQTVLLHPSAPQLALPVRGMAFHAQQSEQYSAASPKQQRPHAGRPAATAGCQPGALLPRNSGLQAAAAPAGCQAQQAAKQDEERVADARRLLPARAAVTPLPRVARREWRRRGAAPPLPKTTAPSTPGACPPRLSHLSHERFILPLGIHPSWRYWQGQTCRLCRWRRRRSCRGEARCRKHQMEGRRGCPACFLRS